MHDRLEEGEECDSEGDQEDAEAQGTRHKADSH